MNREKIPDDRVRGELLKNEVKIINEIFQTINQKI